MKTLATCLFIILFLGNISAQTFPYERDWATYYGPHTTFVDSGEMDSQGNVYILSYVEAYAMENEANDYTTPGTHQTNYGGGEADIFLFKFDPQGNLLWATFYGGEGYEQATNMVVDDNDNIYVVGTTNSDNNIASPNSFQETRVPSPVSMFENSTSFLAKFSNNGQLLWGTYIDGEQSDGITGIDAQDGTIIIVGATNSAMHLSTPGSFQPSITFSDVVNQRVGLIMKFDENGNRIWGTYYGTGENYDAVSDVDMDTSGNIYVTGATIDATGYFATTEVYQNQNNGGSDLFISKFSLTGNRIWSTYYGGENEESEGRLIALRNQLYISGQSKSENNIASTGAYQENLIGVSGNPILAKFDTYTGNRVWGTYYGGSGTLNIGLKGGVFFEESSIWLSGSTNSETNIATQGAYQEFLNPDTNGSESDGYFAKFSENGNLLFASYYGGNKRDKIINVLPGNNEDNFYLVGTTQSPNAIATPDGYQPALPTGNNPTNSFLVKFVPEGMGVNNSSISQWSLWPNPTSGKFTIQGTNLGEMQLSLYDFNGRKLFSQNEVKVGQSINLQGELSAGLYFLKVKNDQQKTQVLKLIVK